MCANRYFDGPPTSPRLSVRQPPLTGVKAFGALRHRQSATDVIRQAMNYVQCNVTRHDHQQIGKRQPFNGPVFLCHDPGVHG